MTELVRQVRVLAASIEIDLSTARIAELLGIAGSPEDGITTLTSEVRITRTGRAMRLVTGAGMTFASQRPDEALVRLLQKARRWWSRICDGLTVSELARDERVSSTYITRVARLAMLAPKLVDEILSGSHGAMLNATRLLQIQDLPGSWVEQEKLASKSELSHPRQLNIPPDDVRWPRRFQPYHLKTKPEQKWTENEG